jgi:hypothetical protein
MTTDPMPTCDLCHDLPVAEVGMFCARCRDVLDGMPEAAEFYAAARRTAALARFIFADRARPAIECLAAKQSPFGVPAIAVGVGLILTQRSPEWQLHHFIDDRWERLGPRTSFATALASAFGCWCDHVIHTHEAVHGEVR